MIHHITHIDNLENILKSGFLFCRNKLNNFQDTANLGMILSRTTTNDKDLNNYVPFHSDFLQQEHKIPYNKDVLDRFGHENMVFLVADLEDVKGNIYYFYHPKSRFAKEYIDLEKFIKDFNQEYSLLFKQSYPYYGDPRIKQFLMSEILFEEKFSVIKIKKIVVYSNDVKIKVSEILKKCKLNSIEVDVKENFFRR